MAASRITGKGQVTIPRSVRSALGVEAGDGLVFVVEGGRVFLVPVKRRSLTDLYASLRINGAFVGVEEERRQAREHIARRALGTPESNNE